MRTIKYQSGGIYYTPFISQPSQTQQVQSKSSNSEDKGKQLIEKEIISVLKENGLQNDVDYFLNAANSFLVSNSGFSDSIRNMGQSREYNIGELIKLQSYANRVKHNKEMFTLAKNQVTKEGAGSEVALTDSGEMYVLDGEGKLNIISAKAYAENQEDYRVLTNSELMSLRANSKSLTYNDTILENLQNTVGIKSIVEYVNKTINEFGTRKRSGSSQSYVEKNKSTIEKGIEQLLGYGPEGMYKLTNSTKSEQQGYDESSKDREEQLFTAVNYLYSTLPTNMKNVLKAHTAAEGGNPNSAKDVLSLLTNAIQFNTNHSIDTDTKVDYDSTASKASGGSGSEKAAKQVPETFGDMVFNFKGDNRTNSMVLGENIQFNIPTRFYIPRNFNNESIPNINTANEVDQNLRDWGLRDVRNKAYFGDVPIDNMSVVGNSIIVDYEQGMGQAPLPVNANGDIDFSILTLMNNIQKDITSKGITDDKEKAKIWEAAGFSYNPEIGVGCPKGYRLKWFALQNAYVTSKSGLDNKALKNSIFNTKIDNDIIENLESLYNLQHKGEKDTLKLDIDYNTVASMWNNSYKGILYIPLTQNPIQSSIASKNAYIDRRDTSEYKAQQDYRTQIGGYDPQSGTTIQINTEDFE